MAVWNTVLSAGEVSALYEAPVYGPYGYGNNRNFDMMGSNADPSFSGSVASFIQGINVTTYQRFGQAIAPLLCRADEDTYYLSSSSGTITRLTASSGVFDDSFSYPGNFADLNVTAVIPQASRTP